MKTTLKIDGMTCPACEARVREALLRIAFIDSAEVHFETGMAQITHEIPLNDSEIRNAIEEAGYQYGGPVALTTLQNQPSSQTSKWAFVGLLAVVLLIFVISPASLATGLQLPPTLSYASLFMLGLLVSVHCIGMCGGIVLSQCLKSTHTHSFTAALLYNAGRVLSYTLVGALAGFLGSTFTISYGLKGSISIIAGLFMILMGLNLAGFFRAYAKFLPRFKSKKLETTNPFAVGMLNGLMPCGPLQAMQLYALGTGSPMVGALSMFFFSLGTAPALLGLGTFSTFIGKRFNKQLIVVSGVLVIFLGIITIQRGLTLIPIISQIQFSQPAASEITDSTVKEGYQTVKIDVKARGYGVIRVKKGIPVQFNLYAREEALNGCNNGIIIPSFNIEKTLAPGDNIVEFTPTEVGTYEYTCWMSMIRSKIIVVE